jgi:hypothetical protein
VDDTLDAPPLTLTAVSGQSISLTADMLKALSPEQIYKIYQTYIKELSAQLVELNKGSTAAPEATAQVEKLTKEVVSMLAGPGAVLCCAMCVYCRLMRRVIASRLLCRASCLLVCGATSMC